MVEEEEHGVVEEELWEEEKDLVGEQDGLLFPLELMFLLQPHMLIRSNVKCNI